MKHCIAAVLLTCLLQGCSVPPTAPAMAPLALFNDSAFSAADATPGSEDIFALSPAMRQFLQSPAVVHTLRAKGAQRGLFEVLRDQSGLRIAYDTTQTRTAAQAFEARAGNCLSLVILTAALARALDIPVYFQEVRVAPAWTRSGGLYFAAGHVNIGLRRPVLERGMLFDASQELVIDFLPPADLQNQPMRRIPQATVVAMYLNNRAAEALASGHIDQAYGWVRQALLQASDFAPAYNTLGVVYLRRGDGPRAQAALEAALQRDPTQLMALSNLAQAVELQGHAARAAQLRAQLLQREPHPPYAWFDQGMAAMGRQDYAAARALFAREIQRDPYNAEFHFWQAQALYRLGDQAEAGKQLRLAMEAASNLHEHDLYAAKLARLQALGGADAPAAPP